MKDAPFNLYSKIEHLAENIDDVNNNVKYLKSKELGWNVTDVRNTKIISQTFSESATVSEIKKNDIVIGHSTPDYIERMLPYPIDMGVVVGTTDTKAGLMTNAYVRNNCLVRYKYYFFNHLSGGDTANFINNILVHGVRMKPPAKPQYEVKDKRLEAVEIAKSYYLAQLNGRKFAYGENFVSYNSSNKVNNSKGAALFECDTLVALSMMGIPYEKSPYKDNTPNLAYNFSDLELNPNNYTWCLPLNYNEILKRKITYTGAMNWFFWYNKLVFSDIDEVASGDIVIFTKTGKGYFDDISHIGLINVEEENGKKEIYVYHMTSGVKYMKLEEEMERDPERTVYFARPNYE